MDLVRGVKPAALGVLEHPADHDRAARVPGP